MGTQERGGGPARAEQPDEPQRLKDALRKARIDTAERTGVVVDLHDAEVARLELLNEALDPLFSEIPSEVDLFDRGISRGETPGLWIDAIAHVAMGRDKRVYRFVQDTRYGRKVLAETVSIPEMVEAVTKYVAQRLIEREQAMAVTAMTRRSATSAAKPCSVRRLPAATCNRRIPVRVVRGLCDADRRRAGVRPAALVSDQNLALDLGQCRRRQIRAPPLSQRHAPGLPSIR